MKKTLQIINMDGTEGSGKSTQINSLAGYFRKQGHLVLVNRMDDNISSATESTKKTMEFLEENPDGLVINDGSIARMIVVDLTKGLPQTEAAQKYKDLIHNYEVLNHKYGMANILFVMEDLDECNRRLKKEAELLSNTSYKSIVPTVESTVISGIRRFDNNTLSRNLNFRVIEIDVEDKILEVQDTLISLLESSFKIKKPSNYKGL